MQLGLGSALQISLQHDPNFGNTYLKFRAVQVLPELPSLQHSNGTAHNKAATPLSQQHSIAIRNLDSSLVDLDPMMKDRNESVI